MCRAPLGTASIRAVWARPTKQPEEFPVFTPPGTRDPSSDRTPWGSPTSQVEMQTFPWWPKFKQITENTGNDRDDNQTESVYHSSTQLPDGRLSVIIDPGPWTNLIGCDLARKQVTRALKNGLAPKQTKIKPFNVAGVGKGTQTCKFGIHTPIAVEHADDQRSTNS